MARATITSICWSCIHELRSREAQLELWVLRRKLVLEYVEGVATARNPSGSLAIIFSVTLGLQNLRYSDKPIVIRIEAYSGV